MLSPNLKYKHTTPRKAAAVLALVKAKVPYSIIKAQEHVTHSTITRIKARAQENPHDPTATRARSGRPNGLSDRDKRALVRDAVHDRECTVQSLCKKYRCSKSTVLKTLDEKNYHKRVARYKPFLTSKQKKARLAFAKAYVHWTEKDWEKVMFSDECNIELGLDSRIVRVWRRPDEEFHDTCIKPTFKSGRTSVGIWSYIMGKEIGPIVLLEGRMTGQKYKDMVMEEVVWPRVRRIGRRNKKFHYMHDGAPCYRAKLVKEYMEEKEIRVLPWPASSPDLNPIENLWCKLK